MKPFKEWPLLAKAGAVIGVLIVLSIIFKSQGSGGGGGVSGGTCSKAMGYLSNASSDVSDGDGQDLWFSANDAFNVAENSSGGGSKVADDLLTLEDDALAWQDGSTSSPGNAVSDLKT